MTYKLEATDQGMDLVVTGDWTPEATNAIEQGRADGVVLNYARGYRSRDLNFLRDLPLRRLHLIDRAATDLTPVTYLAQTLTSLRVQSDPGAVIPLEALSALRILSAEWGQVRASITYARLLERLFLTGYDEPDLGPLSSLQGLVSLVLKDRPRVKSLDGMEYLPWLAELSVHTASGLADINAVARTSSPALQTLQLSSCRKVTDLQPLRSCYGLSFLEFSDCGDVASLSPLGHLDHLERLYLYGSTRVLDNDLSPVLRLPRLHDFRMQSRRDYRPSVQDIQKSISSRST